MSIWTMRCAAVAILLHLCATAPAQAQVQTTEPVRIIIDTDMGSDCDDAGALALLHALADKGEARILAVIFSSGRNPYGVGVCDAINTYYGRGDLPLGQYKGNDVGDPKDRYCRAIATNTNMYHNDVISSAPEMLSVYKETLSAQSDGSVTIVTIGHPHALSLLLKDPDAERLLRSKVVKCVSMAGAPDAPASEWNLCQPGLEGYVENMLNHLPVPHYFSPMGEQVITGNQKLPATATNNPVREAFLLYEDSLHKGRPSWDEVAVLFAVRPQLFNIEAGTLKQTGKLQLLWTSQPTAPPKYRVKPKLSNADLAALIEDLMSTPPARGH